MSKTYTTVQGDMWDSIAYAQLGDVSYTGELMSCNLAYREYLTFPAGIVLTLPEITDNMRQNDALPPWKRVST